MTCITGFGPLLDGDHSLWMGDFGGVGHAQVLMYYQGDHNWWLGDLVAGQLQWGNAPVANTQGFGPLLDSDHSLWMGDFGGVGHAQVLMYYQKDHNWWLGDLVAGQLQWGNAPVANTQGFGPLLDGDHSLWIGDFGGVGHAQVLMYYQKDHNWWLGDLVAGQLQWGNAPVANTQGFGPLLDGDHSLWIGDFGGVGHAQVLMYYQGDHNWWLGDLVAGQLQWGNAPVANTQGFGPLLDSDHSLWIGDFGGVGHAQVLMYYQKDHNWWLGDLVAGQLQWGNAPVANTQGFGPLLDSDHSLWIGDFAGVGHAQVLMYYQKDHNWWLGDLVAGQLQWGNAPVANTQGFGPLLDSDHSLWIGDFARVGHTQVLMYHHSDGNWWLGNLAAGALQWIRIGDTGRVCIQSINVHFKTVIPRTAAVNTFINNQFIALQQLYDDVGIAAYRGTTEDLSAVRNPLWTTAANTQGFGPLLDGDHSLWMGDFAGVGHAQVLMYYQGDHNWWLGDLVAGQLQWGNAPVANTQGFGPLLDGDHSLWMGDFGGVGHAQVLMYYQKDHNWWLGDLVAGQLQWGNAPVANTQGFGPLLDSDHSLWMGDFGGVGHAQVLMYYQGDHNWWLGDLVAGQLQWGNAPVANTQGFGPLLDGDHSLWIGDFGGVGHAQVLMYYQGDHNWWLGDLVAGQLQWGNAPVANTQGFGPLLDSDHSLWIGDFGGVGHAQVLMYYQKDHNWWLGDLVAGQLQWGNAPVANTQGFGPLLDSDHSLWIGDFGGVGHAQVLMYYQGDHNWWLGDLVAGQLQWGNAPVANTQGFGPLLDSDHSLWIGDFGGVGHAQVLMYYQKDHNWWLGEMFGLRLSSLSNFNVGTCVLGRPTANDNVLFANRNNASAEDIVVYVAQTLIGTTPGGGPANYVGCATSPAGQPGVVVVQTSAPWLVAHEIGHVLGLGHVPNLPATNTDSLMWPTIGWTNVPPDLSPAEMSTMLLSNLSHNC